MNYEVSGIAATQTGPTTMCGVNVPQCKPAEAQDRKAMLTTCKTQLQLDAQADYDDTNFSNLMLWYTNNANSLAAPTGANLATENLYFGGSYQCNPCHAALTYLDLKKTQIQSHLTNLDCQETVKGPVPCNFTAEVSSLVPATAKDFTWTPECVVKDGSVPKTGYKLGFNATDCGFAAWNGERAERALQLRKALQRLDSTATQIKPGIMGGFVYISN